MANPEHLKILKQGVGVWNKWRKENPDIIPDLSKADVSGASLSEAHLHKAILNEAKLIRADLGGAFLTGAELIGADLSGAEMNEAILTGADLSKAKLTGANLIRAYMMRADLKMAHLIGADLSEATMIGANLSEAQLSTANLSGARLDMAYLKSANLSEAKLIVADLNNADLGHSQLFETVLGSTNLTNAKNLGSISHAGPSTIDHRTLEISGDLPLEFLRGCGLSDWQIEAAKLNNPDLTPTEISEIVYKIDNLRSENPIQIHNLFISYSHMDSGFVEKIEKDLKRRKILYWRDIHDAPAGPLERIVVRAMRQNPTVLLILSKNSVNSDWVEYEAEKARELEKELDRHVLCPIALDESWKTCNWSAVLRNQIKKYNILNFSRWKDETDFESKFDRLLQGLDLFYKRE